MKKLYPTIPKNEKSLPQMILWIQKFRRWTPIFWGGQTNFLSLSKTRTTSHWGLKQNMDGILDQKELPKPHRTRILPKTLFCRNQTTPLETIDTYYQYALIWKVQIILQVFWLRRSFEWSKEIPSWWSKYPTSFWFNSQNR